MLIRCREKDTPILMEYLAPEKEYNTFLMADLKAYGFDSEFQDVWMDQAENGECRGIYLRFYTNLLVYSREGEMNPDALAALLKKDEISVIMGKSSLFSEQIRQETKDYQRHQKQMYRLGTKEWLINPFVPVIQAEAGDVDDIFQFLGGIDEIKGLYTSKDMIRDRITSGDGIHLMIREGDRVIAHGNSTTGSPFTTMIGGVATAPEYRRKGYASCVVSALAEYITSQGKTPCLFADDTAAPLFVKLGFEQLGGWTTLERK